MTDAALARRILKDFSAAGVGEILPRADDSGSVASDVNSEVHLRAARVLDYLKYIGLIDRWDGLRVYLSESSHPKWMIGLAICRNPGIWSHVQIQARLEDLTRNNLLVLETMES